MENNKKKINKKTLILMIVIIGMLVYSYIPAKYTNYNSKSKLNIVSSYGDDEAYHPKVLIFREKWNGYKYWMSYTPYPAGNCELENPCIVASNNLIKWETPEGLTNPLDDISKDGDKNKYDSDAHIVYNSDLNRLECFWRYVDNNENRVIIYRKYSTNGVDFSEKEIFIQSDDRSKNDYVSPAIIYENSKYKMWYVDHKQIEYMETADGKAWSEEKPVEVKYKGGKLYTWHIDVIKTEKGYEMITVAYQNVNNRKTMKLYYTYSESETENWTKAEKILDPTTRTNNWDNSGLYRSSMIYENGVYIVFYSGRSTSNDHGIGIVYGKNIKKLKSVSINFKDREETNDLLDLINKYLED